MMKEKRVIVTGAAGFIGTNLILRLLADGVKVTGIYHNKMPRIKNERVNFVKADLSKKDECEKVLRDADTLIMAAAYVGGAEKILSEPMKFVSDTTIINLNTLAAAYSNGIKNVIYISSGMGYAESRLPLKEENAYVGEPYKKYFCGGWSRRYTEIICRMYCEFVSSPMNITALRIDNIYGPYDSFKWEKSHVMPALIRKAVERMSPLEVWGDGKDYKDFIYIDDLVDGILLAMDHMDGYKLYNIASGKNVTINDVLKIILKETDYENADIVYNRDKPTMIPYKVMSIEKAQKEIGFNPKIGIEEGVHRTVDWYMKNQEKKEEVLLV